jgi:hypothetical protein
MPTPRQTGQELILKCNHGYVVAMVDHVCIDMSCSTLPMGFRGNIAPSERKILVLVHRVLEDYLQQTGWYELTVK